MKMQTLLLISSAILLGACGGKTEEPAAAQNGGAPKPVFKVKYLDQSVIEGLALEQAEKGETNDKKPFTAYTVKGLGGDNKIELIGKHPNDLEVISGKCMETDDKGAPAGWPENGVCHTLFAKMAGNSVEDGANIVKYLVEHAALTPYTGKSGYAAVQNGRYVLELDSEGMFYFRRRNYN